MARLSEFVQAGEAFRLTAYRNEEGGRNVYMVEFTGNGKRMSYEELLVLVARMQDDMANMFFRWSDGGIDNDMVNRLEWDWRRTGSTEAPEGQEAHEA